MERLVVGLVRGVHGLRGAVRVEVLSDQPARFAPGSLLHPEGGSEPLTVAWSQADGPGLLVRFSEVPSRTEAEALRNRYLEAEVDPAALPDEAVWWHELEGVPVVAQDGQTLGAIVDVFRAGGAEVLVVHGGSRGELYVPNVRPIVTEFAPRAGRIVVDATALGLEPE
ncbi:MAG TPA: ribosome maturation factor RimM [Candidatus Limnocylindrales bacterium]|nr:ribosome maturation factor RimM [Candidatus Limnocylindrales bacterium]